MQGGGSAEEHQLWHGLLGVQFLDCCEQVNRIGSSTKSVVGSGFTRRGSLSTWSRYTVAESLTEASVEIPSINERTKETQEFEE